MPVGDDLGLGSKAKYMMVATVAIPRLPREHEELKEMEELDGEEGELLPIGDGEGAAEGDDPEQVEVSDEQVENHQLEFKMSPWWSRLRAGHRLMSPRSQPASTAASRRWA